MDHCRIALGLLLWLAAAQGRAETTMAPHMGEDGMTHGGMDHDGMNHDGMTHDGMDHDGMDHDGMDHDGMDHDGMDHDGMTHDGMDHGGMVDDGTDHGAHGGVDPEGEGGHDTGASHHVQAYFFLATDAVILFEQWVATSTATFVGSCVGVGLLAALYEGLKLVREMIRLKERHILQQTKASCTCSSTCLHLLQTLLHMVQVFVSYCLMMVFMLFNGWLCLAIVLGAGLGYNLLGWKRTYLMQPFAIDGEHCN